MTRPPAFVASLVAVSIGFFATVQAEAASKPKIATPKEDTAPTAEEIAAITFTSNDPQLTDWLTQQSTNHPGDDPDSNQLKQLNDILDRTPLAAPELMTLAHNYRLKTKNLIVPRDIYHAAAKKWESELTQAANNPQDLRTLLNNFAKNRQNIKDVLLPLMEGRHDVIATDTLQLFYADFLKYLPANDHKMASVGQALRTGLAETYYMKGDYNQAISFVEQAADDSTLSGSRWASNEWLWVMTLEKLNKYPEAIDHLQKMIDNKNISQQGAVFSMLIGMALKAHRPELAQSTLDTWATKTSMSDEMKKSYEAQISQASEASTTLPAAVTP
jgi:tetratricopeptide (TPR) repeat protein